MIRRLAPVLIMAAVAALGSCDCRSSVEGEVEGENDNATETDATGSADSMALDVDQESQMKRGRADVDEDSSAAHSEQADNEPVRAWPAELHGRQEFRIDLQHVETPASFNPASLFGDLRTGEARERDYRSGVLPAPNDEVDVLEVLTPRGIERIRLDDAVTTTYGPRHRRFFYLQTNSTKWPSLVRQGAASSRTVWSFAYSQGDAPYAAAYRRADADDPTLSRQRLLDVILSATEDREANNTVLKALRDIRDKPSDAEDRWVLNEDNVMDEEFDAGDFGSIDARFPEPHDRLIFVRHFASMGIEDRGRQPVSTVFLVGEAGGVTEMIREPTFGRRASEVEMIAVADPNGDAIDGVIFEESERLKQSVYWLDFEEGEPRVHTWYELDLGETAGAEGGTEDVMPGRSENGETDETGTQAWPVTVSGGRFRITLGRFGWPKWYDLGRLFGKLGRGGYAYASYVPAAMPEPYSDLEAVDVLVDGEYRRMELAEFSTGTSGPDHDRYYHLETRKLDEVGDHRGYQWTFARAPVDPSDPQAPQREVESASPAIDLSSLLTALVEPHADDSTDNEVLRRLRKIKRRAPDAGNRWSFDGGKFDEADFETVDADLPPPHAGLVYVSSDSDWDAGLENGGGESPAGQSLYLVDSEGNVTRTLQESEFTYSSPKLSIQAVADPDRDGVDSVLYRRRQSHNVSANLLELRDGELVQNRIFFEVFE